MDPELLAMSRILRQLEELDLEARSRVINYLSLRFRCGYSIVPNVD